MRSWVAAVLALAAAACPAGEPAPLPAPVEKPLPKPRPVAPPAAQAIGDAVARGVAFLLAHQNKDGSWGSAHQTKGLNIYAPVPGAHLAFRAAVTALCVMALVETDDRSPAAQQALDRGEAWLLQHLGKVRRAEPAAVYNVWSHAYGLQALVRMIQRRPGDAARVAQLRALLEDQVGRLARYESVDGGWGYYDFRAHTQKPSGYPTSFTTATGLLALREAQDAGADVPPRLVSRALAALRRQQKPDFSYLYAEHAKWWPMADINRPGGSLGRSQACNLALRLWGDPRVTDAVLTTWLDRLFARNEWLGMGRKRPIPHESWFAVAGYFFYYGHYYAALCIEQLPPADRPLYQAHLAHLLLSLQEKDGSWWDYPFYDYHQPYGTAFVLLCLRRCR
jgi:hypothetical protein